MKPTKNASHRLLTKHVKLILLACLTTNLCPLQAEDFTYYEKFNFKEGNFGDNEGFSLYACQGPQSSAHVTEQGELEIRAAFWDIWCPSKFDGVPIPPSDEWSVRMLVTASQAEGFGIGTIAYDHVLIVNNGQTMSVGVNVLAPGNDSQIPMPLESQNERLYFQMDLFDGIITGSIWPEGDPGSMIQLTEPGTSATTIPGFGVNFGRAVFHDLMVSSKPIPIIDNLPGDFDGNLILDTADLDLLVNHFSDGNPIYDLTGDGLVDREDHRFWITELKNTWHGDANLDGVFDSGDMVQVFKVGEYEDNISGNSTWSEGDWNADGDFDSGDLVEAFKDGGFEKGPRDTAMAVPEPTEVPLIALALLTFALARKARK